MTKPITFGNGETVLVIGLGRTGMACVQVLRERGARVFAIDEKPAGQLTEQRAQVERLGASVIAPDALAEILPTVESAVLSPGVPMDGSLVRSVKAAGVAVLAEIEIAYRLCAAPIIAVTGTKGKSTTTALVGHLLRACGKTVYVGGNIGNPLIGEVGKAGRGDWVVAEVSSFQLESIQRFRPRVAVVLNVSADHLDRYVSLADYAAAKFRIFANQTPADWFIGNLADPRLEPLHRRHSQSPIRAQQRWFTVAADHAGAAMFLRDGALMYDPGGSSAAAAVLRADQIPLAGAHNVENVMAAILAAASVGLDPRALAQAVRSFRPMAHRLETVENIDGVIYVDDSKATNPDAVIAALRAYDSPIHLIAGGRSKGTDFAALGRTIDERAKTLIVIGEAADELASCVERAKTVHAATIEEAVRAARSFAEPGDIVLLSPGCASFDMFSSAEDRGEKFAAAARTLREVAGA